MKTSTKLFIAAAILIILPTGGGTIILGLFCFITGLILLIIQGINNHTNNTAPRSDAGKTKYTYEARKASDSVKSKRKQDDTPPWEE